MEGRARSKVWRAPEVRLVAWGFALNAVWEALQSPLYADFGRPIGYLLWTRLHCTGGDVLILLAAFWGTALLFRARFWASRRGFPAAVVFVLAGFVYTAWSEIHNTQVSVTWAYAPEMPQIYGVGLAPLLQWLVIPPVLVRLLRHNPYHSKEMPTQFERSEEE